MPRKILAKSMSRLCMKLFSDSILVRVYFKSSCPLSMGNRNEAKVPAENVNNLPVREWAGTFNQELAK